MHTKMELNKQIRDPEARVEVVEEWPIDNEMHVASERANVHCQLLEWDGKLQANSSTPDFLDILTDILADIDMNISDGSVN